MRALNRLVATLLALALAVGGALVLYEVVRVALGYHHGQVIAYSRLARAMRRNSWDDLGPIIGSSVCVAVGLLLLLLGLRRGKPDALTLTPLADDVETVTTRRSLQKAMRRTATETEGVSSAKVKVGRRKATVKASSPLRRGEGLDARIRERLEAQLTEISLAKPPRLKIKTSTREDPA